MFVKALLATSIILTTICSHAGVTPDISNGIDASDERAPWQVSLVYQGDPICGGSLIHPRFVLTAAHCVRLKSVKGFELKAGSAKIESLINLPRPKQIYSHPEYFDWVNGVKVADVALIELESDFTPSDTLKTIDLPTEDINNHDSISKPLELSITGWGYTRGHREPSTLQLLEKLELWKPNMGVGVINNGSIDKSHMNLLKTFRTGAYLAIVVRDAKSACRGDSGGPMVREDKREIIGIASHGTHDQCGKATAFFYTKVYRYLSWINEIIGTPKSILFK